MERGERKRSRLKLVTWKLLAMCLRPSVPLDQVQVKIQNHNFQVYFLRHIKKKDGVCVVPNMKHVIVWVCLSVGELFKIRGTLSQHCYHNTSNLFFNRTMSQNTPPGCVRAIRWPSLHNH